MNNVQTISSETMCSSACFRYRMSKYKSGVSKVVLQMIILLVALLLRRYLQLLHILIVFSRKLILFGVIRINQGNISDFDIDELDSITLLVPTILFMLSIHASLKYKVNATISLRCSEVGPCTDMNKHILKTCGISPKVK